YVPVSDIRACPERQRRFHGCFCCCRRQQCGRGAWPRHRCSVRCRQRKRPPRVVHTAVRPRPGAIQHGTRDCCRRAGKAGRHNGAPGCASPAGRPRLLPRSAGQVAQEPPWRTACQRAEPSEHRGRPGAAGDRDRHHPPWRHCSPPDDSDSRTGPRRAGRGTVAHRAA
ncbi:hypothetical protein H4R19_006929, partial [Coemansia spiralis]